MRSLRNALLNIRRTPYQTLASLFIMVLTFFLMQFFIIDFYSSNRILQHYEQLPKVSAYFTIDATQDDVNQVEQKLQETGKVAHINFISQDDALKIYNDRFKDKPELTQFVQKDFFPMSLDIQAYKASDLDQVVGVLKSFDKVEEVTYLKDDIQKLLAYTNTTRTRGLITTSFAIMTSIFTILVIIGMKISSKRDEIEVKQLLGASPWYIRSPFLMEGMLYGLIGAIIAFFLGLIPFFYVPSPNALFFQDPSFSIYPNIPLFLSAVFGIQAIVGIIVGAIGSFIALLRFL